MAQGERSEHFRRPHAVLGGEKSSRVAAQGDCPRRSPGTHPGLPRFPISKSSKMWVALCFCSIRGVDTGDIVAQERIPVEKGDSFMTLSWKGVIRIAQLQAAALGNLDQGQTLPRRKIISIPPGSEFDNPTFGQFLRYRLSQNLVR
jgi:hypothetical protein